jgi:aryl-alcohol dehydrogenase-like predicted oxidoreductase
MMISVRVETWHLSDKVEVAAILVILLILISFLLRKGDKPMKYRFFGKSGLKVSELCLGAMTFGRESTKEVSFQILDRFVEAGGNFIDTANVYSTGVSESVVGEWLKDKNRADFIIATKVRGRMGPGPNQEGLSRKHIMDQIDASLKRLGTDYVDLYQVHSWDDATPLEETLSTLDMLVKAGKVRYIGASNYAAWHLQKAVDLSLMHGWEKFINLQPLYNLLDRELEWELIPLCQNEGLATMIWSPLRGGWLTGKYRRGMADLPEGRVKKATEGGWSESWDEYTNERTWNIIEEVEAVAKESNRSMAQVALRWLLQRPGVTCPIIGVRTLQHLEDNLAATEFELSADQMNQLNEVSELNKPYPYFFIGSRKE